MTPEECLAYWEQTVTAKIARQMAIISLHESGYSYGQIAKALELSKSQTWRIAHGL